PPCQDLPGARQINKTPFRVGVDTGGELIERNIERSRKRFP
ncbi:hypothetical protein LTSEMON_0220, partial [Salmonella enterica subsp. enterica serovar Montevideo str. S5-403]